MVEALDAVRGSLRASAPVPRWGLGYVQGGQVLLSRTPRLSEQDVDFYTSIERLTTDYIIGHAAGDDGLRGNENTQPFRYRTWMFAQDCHVPEFEKVQAALLEHLPPFLRRNVKGKTPAEHLFNLFLAFLHDGGKLDDPNLPLAETRRALRDAAALFASLETKAGLSESGLGNVIVSNARSMLAVRLGGPLYTRRLKVPEEGEADTFRGVFAVSCPENPGEGFEEIPERSALAIWRDLRTEIASLDD
jgi:glutamine amidotransferase